MATYIYLPVADPELVNFAYEWGVERERKGKTAHTVISPTSTGMVKAVRRIIGRKVLGRLSGTDTLYVLIHGASREGYKGAEKVSATRSGGKRKIYDATELAEHLQAEDLNKNLVDLRLYACSAGLVPQATGLVSTAPTSQPSNLSFAKRLKDALVQLGYSHVMVTGYLDNLKMGYNAVFVEHGDASNPHATHLTQEQYKFTESGHRAEHHKTTF